MLDLVTTNAFTTTARFDLFMRNAWAVLVILRWWVVRSHGPLFGTEWNCWHQPVVHNYTSACCFVVDGCGDDDNDDGMMLSSE